MWNSSPDSRVVVMWVSECKWDVMLVLPHNSHITCVERVVRVQQLALLAHIDLNYVEQGWKGPESVDTRRTAVQLPTANRKELCLRFIDIWGGGASGTLWTP